MVKIASKDFNKSLGNYIDKRRSYEGGSGKLFSFKFGLKKNKRADEEVVPEIGPSEVHVEYKQPGFLSRLFKFRRGLINEAVESEDLTPAEMAKLRSMEDDIEDTEKEIMEKEHEIRELRDDEEDLVEKREGILTTFFSKINIFSRRPTETVEIHDDEYIDEPALDEDVVEVLKAMHKWIEQLTPAKKRSFKASKDFQLYKAVLEKYGLIRKK
ncbi:MAG: hypothetical protein KKF46_07390 [Nanoarchaeota archaeon]|nr:hypothetical protein [Nanoarchaeota archaeon]MBU1322151.1 hypothetical protein [Nanoarchaeota archaeon]MBU1597872.1 hypothetical protein [Nanoarchaeota archaeon]MBU2441291.1 hypothetical protein [Nanoarchaeota archaeon]